MVGPPGMPDNQRQAWTEMLTRMRTSRTWQETLQKQDWTDAFLTGEQFGAFLKSEDERTAKVLKDVGLIQ
jgi:putative tricarboxylic transport membrane protein